MAQPSSRQELIDYCLRQLGAPVLEVNVAEEQIQDLVDDAIQFFQERHFDVVAVPTIFVVADVVEIPVDPYCELGAPGGLARPLFTSSSVI